MNKHFETVAFKLGEADAILSTVENIFDDLDLLPEDREKMNRAAYLFYAAWGAVKKADEELENYRADCRIVNVLHAVREARGS